MHVLVLLGFYNEIPQTEWLTNNKDGFLTVLETAAAAAATKLLQLCLTLCNPIDGSPPASPIPGILQEEHWSGLLFPSPMHESEM